MKGNKTLLYSLQEAVQSVTIAQSTYTLPEYHKWERSNMANGPKDANYNDKTKSRSGHSNSTKESIVTENAYAPINGIIFYNM